MPAFEFSDAPLRRDVPGLNKLLLYHRRQRRTRDDLRYSIHSHAFECRHSVLNTGAHMLPEGVRRLKKFQELMASGFRSPLFLKTYFTQEWDHHVIPTLAASIVGEEWAQYGQGICEDNGWVHVTPQVAISSPRQFGKTGGGIGRTIAALLAAVPGRHEIVCSTGKRISKMVIEVIAKHLKHLGYAKQIKISHATEGSRIDLLFEDGTISQVIGVPANARMSIYFFFFSFSLVYATVLRSSGCEPGVFPVSVFRSFFFWICLQGLEQNREAASKRAREFLGYVY